MKTLYFFIEARSQTTKHLGFYPIQTIRLVESYLTSARYSGLMTHKNPVQQRIMIALRLADDTILPVEMAPESSRFIGHYSRLAAFGPLGAQLRKHIVDKR